MALDMQELARDASEPRLRADALRIILGIQNRRSESTPICLVDGAQWPRETKA
jgi:hypothetical protein